MDPITQGALGAALPQSLSNKKNVGRAGLFGFVAGMAADLDVFIRSSEDPLLFLEFHRQFTHSLVFIPVGGAVCGVLLFLLIGRRWGLSLRQSVFYCTLGYATHALLDACTSYGTQLFWPFSDMRIAWNAISVVDPLFTLPVLAGVLAATLKQKPRLALAALIWAVCYMSLGIYQREAALQMGEDLAALRGHTWDRMEAKPSFANLLVWKTVYETQDRFYVDAVRPGFSKQVFEGRSIAKLDVQKDFGWLNPASQQAKDIERFRWFSDGYVAQNPDHPDSVIDVRYSLLPNEIAALWLIELSKTAPLDRHALFLTRRDKVSEKGKKLWDMILGRQSSFHLPALKP